MRNRPHFSPKASQRQAAGFTLMETLIVLAIIGIMSAYAMPSFMQSMNRATVTTQTSAFASAIRVTRTEAIRRGRMATLCRSDNPEAAAPTCAAGAGGAVGWASGWVIFEDSAAARGVIEPGETIITVQAPFTGSGGFVDQGANGNSLISFVPSGMPFGGIGRTFLVFPNSADRATTSRVTERLVVSAIGRVTIAKLNP